MSLIIENGVLEEYIPSGETDIVIPEGVTSIKKLVFYGLECQKIKSITLPRSLTVIERCAFDCCRYLQSVEIPDSVTRIEDYAFNECGIRSISIPNSVTSIGDHAFSRCKNLQSITIPESVTSIGDSAFLGCKNLEFIEIPSGVYIDRNTFFETKWARDFPDDFIVLNGVLIGYKGEQSKVIIPDNVRVVGFESFLCYEKLKEIVIPKTVEKIGAYAFADCENLELITIENPNTEIGNMSFYDCPNVKCIICHGRCVTIDNSNDKVDDFTDTVLDIVELVRHENEHI